VARRHARGSTRASAIAGGLGGQAVMQVRCQGARACQVFVHHGVPAPDTSTTRQRGLDSGALCQLGVRFLGGCHGVTVPVQCAQAVRHEQHLQRGQGAAGLLLAEVLQPRPRVLQLAAERELLVRGLGGGLEMLGRGGARGSSTGQHRLHHRRVLDWGGPGRHTCSQCHPHKNTHHTTLHARAHTPPRTTRCARPSQFAC